MKLLFSKKQLVHFGDADPQGILYFAKISQWGHEMIEEYWAQSSLGWAGWFRSSKFAVPLRHTEQDFLAPMTVGTELSVQLYVSEISDSSVRFKVDFLLPNETVAATAQSVHVFVDRTTFKKILVPDSIRSILK